MTEQELQFYKDGTGIQSVSLKNSQLFLLKVKYKDEFSLSQWLQEKLTEEAIMLFIKKVKDGRVAQNNKQH